MRNFLKIRLSSDSDRPNKGTRSHNRLGYTSLLNKMISASIPVAVVLC